MFNVRPTVFASAPFKGHGKDKQEQIAPGKNVPGKRYSQFENNVFTGTNYLNSSAPLPPDLTLFIWNCYLKGI